MNTLADRLKAAMADAGVRQLDLARATGVSAPSVNNWLSGKTRTLKGVSLVKAAAALGVNDLWLAEGSGPRLRTSGPAPLPKSDESWPFRSLSPERYDQLPDYIKGVIEGRVLAEVEAWEARSRPKEDSPPQPRHK
ncbi:helix-turn-helix domain-containing protein [Achromobacter xylosoxidans]